MLRLVSDVGAEDSILNALSSLVVLLDARLAVILDATLLKYLCDTMGGLLLHVLVHVTVRHGCKMGLTPRQGASRSQS